ncbi:MAG: NB-ARC domain-containing protein, partial [Anaerolineales bacterium]|nr:NB-ARC domain-containing protein [Anaerolineales bacterium]
MLTLTGAGGCGKTRLAIQVATGLAAQDRFKHGVWWVDLAALSDPALVTQSVAMVFNLSESPGMPLIAVLTDYLRAKELLLVVDNCEHLLGACAQLVGALLSACPKLQILATSREALNISGETVWRVPSLAIPDITFIPPLAQLRQFDAIQLFVERATAVAANWRLVENAAPAAQVCARLDGIPLAIELAAARLKVLSAQEIAARLDDRFNLLAGGSRIAMPRHQTLRAAMDWSYDLLSDAERALLRRLSVFAGGFALEAVEAVCAQKDEGGRMKDESEMNALHPSSLILHPFRVLDLLTSLIDKSLVVVETRGNATRYRLLETVRQYAREKLAEANESGAYSRRHRDWFLQCAEQADPNVRSREQLEWCERLELDLENFRAALTWSLEQNDHANAESALRLAGALWWFWMIRGYWNEARTWFERSLAIPFITPARALPLLGLSVMEHYVGNTARCAPLFEEAIALYRQQGDKRGIAFTASLLGTAGNDAARSGALFDEARATARELNDEWLAARTDIGQGMFYALQGEPARAGAFFESALVHARVA